MISDRGSYTQFATFDTAVDAAKYITESITKPPIEGMELTSISMYHNYTYDKKTGKHDYTKKTFRTSLSWATPRQIEVDAIEDAIADNA